jgi:hypothetical protein
MARVAVIGASLGGLVAAGSLRKRGIDVTILERTQSIGGLYGKLDTPFGQQELGMHVIYASEEPLTHLFSIFGEDSFHLLDGAATDIGAHYNFDTLFTNSIYADLRSHPSHEEMLRYIVEASGSDIRANAEETLNVRFGPLAGGVVAPILQKLWKAPPTELTGSAIHCFYDLRRIVIADIASSNRLKSDPRLDSLIANPEQRTPLGTVFGGRKGLFFKSDTPSFATRVNQWLDEKGIELRSNQFVSIEDGNIKLGGEPLSDSFDACIVATPAASLAASPLPLDRLQLSIAYFKLDKTLHDKLDAYYVLCHQKDLLSSRIVNYDSYRVRAGEDPSRVVAVETIHAIDRPVPVSQTAAELKRVLPGVKVVDTHELPIRLSINPPTTHNSKILDTLIGGLELKFTKRAFFLTGMRTDKGIFFSHQTIGAAYEAAVECSRRLA